VPYALVAVQVARGRAIRFGPALAVVSVASSTALMVAGNDLWTCLPWLAAATCALVLGDRWAPYCVLISMAALAGFQAVRYFDEILLFGGDSFLGWFLLYTLVLGLLATTALIASVRFVAVVAELERTRDALAFEAASAERRRLSSDVHDSLGHSLTAISLKADLARRLVADDREAAAVELDELLVIADELDPVAGDARVVGFEAEVTAATALLRSAGIDVDARLELDGLDDATSTTLGWAIREASTNILRHARAQRVWIVAVCEDGQARVDVVNDGATAVAARHGTGLAGIADRAEARGGAAETVALAGGRFRLRVALPLPVPA
jgi:two-component system sensor histidine kinase DesK